MALLWCAWEEKYFDDTLFGPFEGGPRLEHLHVEPRHTSDGLEVGQGAGQGPRPGRVRDVSYGQGPMVKPPRDE